MVETISKEEYDEKVSFLADMVEEACEGGFPNGPSGAVSGMVPDILDGEEWFMKAWYGPAAHGCIIEHSGQDPEHFEPTVSDEKSASETIEQVAYYCLRHDVEEEAMDRLSG